jgi:PhoH-like ATPase
MIMTQVSSSIETLPIACFGATRGKQKIYILDTNVPVADPRCIFAFEDNVVIAPLVLIGELDKFKKDMDARGYNARQFFRIVDNFRKEGATISKGVNLPNGGTFRIEINNNHEVPDSPISQLERTNDNRILRVAFNLQQKENEKRPEDRRQVIIVSNDKPVRITAEAVGLVAQEYESNVVDFDALYTGIGAEVQTIPDSVSTQLYADFEADYVVDGALNNQYFDFKSESTGCLGSMRYANGKVYAVNKFKNARAFDLTARNREQNFALDMLLNDDIKICSLIGTAGTGKTLLAIAAGLEKVSNGVYDKLVVARPIIPVGKDLGYLPGDIDQKMDPWMRPIYDSIELLFMGNSSQKDELIQACRGGNLSAFEKMKHDGVLQIQPLTYIRGLSVPNTFFICDEGQNLEQLEMLTTTTRIGENSKIVITGDPHQIDHPYLNDRNNGLTFVVSRLKGQLIYGHVELVKGERSEVATLCALLLQPSKK